MVGMDRSNTCRNDHILRHRWRRGATLEWSDREGMGLISVGSVTDPYIFGEISSFPNGGIGNRTLTGKTVSKAGLNAGETTGVFVVAGQSNAANCGTTNYTPSNASKVDNLSIYDGGTYAGADPLLGCQNIPGVAGTGNLFTRMADKLITAGKYQRVILIPVAVGGSSVADWNAYLSERLIVSGRRAAAIGLPITAYLWMQGETDN